MDERQIIETIRKKQIKLQASQKEKMLSAILDHTLSKDVINSSQSRNTYMNVFNLSLQKNMFKKMIITLLVLLVTGGMTAGVAYASNDALPGDPLYAVDRVAEKVLGVFMFTENAKARHEMDLLDERMSELESLMQREQVEGENVQGLLGDIEAQQEKVRERLQVGEFSGEDSQRLTNRYEEQLQTHTQTMVKIQSENQNRINQYNLEEDFETVKNKMQEQKGSKSEDNLIPTTEDTLLPDGASPQEKSSEGVMIQDPNRDNYDKDAAGPENKVQNQNVMLN